MSVEMVAVVFDGTHTAEKELSQLRVARDDAWLEEVSVLEHHASGRFSIKATSPDYGDEDHFRAGLAIGGATGLLLGLIAGPIGVLFMGAVGAMTGRALGAQKHHGAFDPLVAQVKDAVRRGSSALILVAEHDTAEQLVSTLGDGARRILRHPLTTEQLEELRLAALIPGPLPPL